MSDPLSGTGPGSALYQEFPPITIGGPTGDYFVVCPVTSSRWVEYAVDSIVNGDVGTAAVVISGNSRPTALNYVGANALSNDTFVYGTPIRIPATTTLPLNLDYERVTNSEKKCFVRIDTSALNSTYVTIRFRARILERIPGPSLAGHPDYEQEVNKLRGETINQRLGAMGIPAYASETNKGAKD